MYHVLDPTPRPACGDISSPAADAHCKVAEREKVYSHLFRSSLGGNSTRLVATIVVRETGRIRKGEREGGETGGWGEQGGNLKGRWRKADVGRQAGGDLEGGEN